MTNDDACSSGNSNGGNGGGSSSIDKQQQSCSCGSCGVRFEACVPAEVGDKARQLWQRQGVRLVSDSTGGDADIHGAGGAMWIMFEVLVLPWFVPKAAIDLLMPLPLVLLELLAWLVKLVRRVLGVEGKRA